MASSDDSSLRVRGRIVYAAWGLWSVLMILLEAGGFIPFEQAVLGILIAIAAMVMQIGTNLTRNNT